MRMKSSCTAIIVMLGVSLLGVSAPSGAVADETSERAPTPVQFRDLFIAGGKPSPGAIGLSIARRSISLAGFFAPPPPGGSPFQVLVGAPTETCPYCTTIDDKEHLPFVLVYGADGQPVSFPPSTRVRVTGRIDTGHENEDVFGIHNDVRIVDAVIVRDARTRRASAPQGARPKVDPLGADSADE